MALEPASDGSLSQSGETSASATTVDDVAVAGGGGDGGDSADNVVGDSKPHVALRDAVETLEVVLSGYAVRDRAGGRERTSAKVGRGGVYDGWKYEIFTHTGTHALLRLEDERKKITFVCTNAYVS